MKSNENADQQGVSRRRFLLWGWGASLALLLGQSLTGLLRFFTPMVEPGGFGGKIVAGQIDEFPPGSITHVSKGRFYVSGMEDGVLVMWHRCTHLGCTVPWREDEGRFHCPCHGGIYNKKGEVLAGPPPRPLDLFSAEVVDGKVVVDTGEVTERRQFDPSQLTST